MYHSSDNVQAVHVLHSGTINTHYAHRKDKKECKTTQRLNVAEASNSELPTVHIRLYAKIATGRLLTDTFGHYQVKAKVQKVDFF